MMVCGKENGSEIIWFLWKSLSSSYISQNICRFWQLLPLLSKSFYSEMFSDCCPQPHPSYSCLPPRRTHKHMHCHEFVYTPAHKSTSRGNRSSCRLWAKKIRATAAVWVRHSSASSFQFSVTVWETGTEKNHYKVQKLVVFLLSTATYAALLISPTWSSELVLASYTDPPESHCLWRTVKKWQPQRFETLKWKWNKK